MICHLCGLPIDAVELEYDEFDSPCHADCLNDYRWGEYDEDDYDWEEDYQ